jgi:hypothetical protein
MVQICVAMPSAGICSTIGTPSFFGRFLAVLQRVYNKLYYKNIYYCILNILTAFLLLRNRKKYFKKVLKKY